MPATPNSIPVGPALEPVEIAPGGGRAPVRPVRRGEPCPRCTAGVLDYNGLLDLECPSCGYTEGPGGGCT